MVTPALQGHMESLKDISKIFESDSKMEKQNMEPAVEFAQTVSIKIPEFSESAVTKWFKVLEGQFKLRKITESSTKFYHATSGIPLDILKYLPEEIMDNEDYEELKQAVTNYHEKSKQELIKKLLSTTTMTGRPSVYVCDLQRMAEKVNAGQDLIRHKFLEALPPALSTALGAQKSLSLNEMAQMADELMPLSKPVNNLQVPEARRNQPQKKSHTYETTEIPYGLRPYNPRQKQTICKAHIYYNDAARTCKPWCKYPNKQRCKIQPSSRSSSPARAANRQVEDLN